jgi:predicted transcriptional regulator
MKTYPPTVVEFTNKVIETLKESNFFELEEVNEEVFYEICCELMLTKFLNNEDILFTSEEFSYITNQSMIMSAVKSLHKKGFVDSIYDEEKDATVVFLTDKGKELSKKLEAEDKKNEI